MKYLYGLFTTFLFISFSTFSQTTPKASSNSPICEGNSLKLTAEGGSNYAWKGPDGFNSKEQNPTINNATAIKSGIYTVVIDNISTATVVVKVGKVVIDNHYAYSGVYNAQFYISNYTNLSSNLHTYLWTGPNGFTSTQQSTNIYGYDKKAQGVYTATITDEFGCISKATTEVKFKNPDCPYYLQVFYKTGITEFSTNYQEGNSAFDLSVCQGSDVVLRIDTTYFGNSKIQWYKDDKEIVGATTLKYSPKERGIYYASLIGKGCEYQSRKMNFRLTTALKPVITANTLENSNVKICSKNGSAKLFGALYQYDVNDAKVTYQWYKNDEIIEGENSSYYTAVEAGSYRLNVRADNCVGETETIKVTLVDKIEAKIYFQDSPDVKELKLCESYTNSIYVKTAAEGYQRIFRNGQQIRSTTFYNMNEYYTQGGLYKLTVTQGECSASDSVRITYGKKQDLTITNYRYLTSNCSALNNGNITYYPKYSLPSGSYQWLKDGSLYTSSSYLYPNTAGNYQLKYNNSQTGCTGESEVIKIDSKFYERQMFRISISPNAKNIKMCKGGSFNISPQTGCWGVGNVWKKDNKVVSNSNSCSYTATEAGKYWLENSSGSCTYYSDTITIEEIALPTVSIKDSCGKDNTVILSALNSTGTSYQWYQNSKAMKGATSSTFTPVGANGIVQVQVGKDGCFANSNTISAGIIVNNPTLSVCRGDTLKLTSSGANIKSYTWVGPNNFASTQQNIAIPNAKTAGVYTITATANSGCIFTNKSVVSIGDYPTFSVSKNIIACEGQELQINAIKSKSLTDSTETADYINWRGPNQFTSSDYNPLITKVSSVNAGVYTASVRSSYSDCQATATISLSIDKSGNCKSISILNRLDSVSLCANTNGQIYFNSTGLSANTKYKVMRVGYNTVLGEGTKSPITFKTPNIDYNSKENLYIITDDGTTRSSDKFYSISSLGTSPRIYQNNYEGGDSFKSCDLLNLYLTESYEHYRDYSNIKSIQWLLDGKEIGGTLSSRLIATKSGNYSVKLTNSTGCSIEGPSQKVTIGQMPKPFVYGQFEILCGQENTNLSVYVGQNPDFVYKWRRDGNIQTNADGGVLKTNKVGKYVVEASLGQCSATSDTIVVTKSSNSKLPISLFRYNNEQNSQILDCANRNFVIGYNSNAVDYNYSKQWQLQVLKDGVEVGLNRYSENSFIVKEPGVYTLKASLGDCAGVSNEVKIESSKTRKANLNYGSLDVCEGKSTYLYKSTSLYSIYDYEKKQSISVTKREPKIYRDNKMIDVKNKVNYDPTVEQVYDYGDFIQLSTPIAGKYYITETATYSDKSECTVITDTIQIKSGKQIQFSNYSFDKTINAIPVNSCKDTVTIYGDYYSSGSRPISYTWKKDGVVTKDSTYQLTTTQAGTYQLETKYKGGCSAISQPYKIDFGKIKVGTNISEATVCEGVANNLYLYANNISGTNDTNKVTYQWQRDGQNIMKETNSYYYAKQEGKYKLNVKQGKCEGASPEVNIKLDKLPTTISPIDTAKFCEGASTPLSLSTESGLSYQWEVDGSGIKNAKNSSYGAASEGTYQALLRRGTCWDYSKKVKVTANILPKTISITDTLICPNLTTTLKVIPDLKAGTKGISYTWEIDNKATTLTNAVEVKAQDKGFYRVQFKRENCSAYSNVVKLNHKDIPTMISPLDTSFCANGKVDLRGQNVANTSYQWEKDEKTITNAITANLTVGEVGKYRVLVKKEGCEVYSKVAKVAQKPATTATISGDKLINYADSAKVSIDFTSDAPWTFKLSDGKDYVVTKSPFEVSLKPQFTTTYSVVEVKNICGIGTTSGTAKIEVIVLSTEDEKDLNVEVFPVPSAEICHWKIQTPQTNFVSVILYDVLGETHYLHTSQNRTQTHEGVIDLTGLKLGTYFLKLQVGDKSVVRKVVKY